MVKQPDIFVYIDNKFVEYLSYEDFETSKYKEIFFSINTMNDAFRNRTCMFLKTNSTYIVNYTAIVNRKNSFVDNYNQVKQKCSDILRKEGLKTLLDGM